MDHLKPTSKVHHNVQRILLTSTFGLKQTRVIIKNANAAMNIHFLSTSVPITCLNSKNA